MPRACRHCYVRTRLWACMAFPKHYRWGVVLETCVSGRSYVRFHFGHNAFCGRRQPCCNFLPHTRRPVGWESHHTYSYNPSARRTFFRYLLPDNSIIHSFRRIIRRRRNSSRQRTYSVLDRIQLHSSIYRAALYRNIMEASGCGTRAA